ncbi:MAG: branched-chain amino acid ABC transporter permease [Candidatus Thiodiazotropha sp.]
MLELQIVVNGVISGMVLAVLALGFSIVYLPCRIFHIALGGIYAVTPFVAMTILSSGGGWPLALIGSVGAAVTIGLLCELLNHRPLEKRQASSGAQLIASLGVYIILVEVVAIIWGNEAQILRSGIDKTFAIGGLTLTLAQVLSGLLSTVLLAALFIWLRFTNMGLRLRALADNPVEFGLRGFNVDAHRLLAFGLSGLLAATAALLTAYDVGFEPHGGLHMLVLAIVAVLIGGRESFYGPVVGGVLLGVLRAVVVWYFSARWQDVATFVLLALFLYVQPHGICGRSGRLEADA